MYLEIGKIYLLNIQNCIKIYNCKDFFLYTKTFDKTVWLQVPQFGFQNISGSLINFWVPHQELIFFFFLPFLFSFLRQIALKSMKQNFSDISRKYSVPKTSQKDCSRLESIRYMKYHSLCLCCNLLILAEHCIWSPIFEDLSWA